MALQGQSPAIGAGNPVTCKSAPVSGVDQRGEQRGVAARGCDIGAFDTGGHGGVVHHTWFVAPSGGGSACAGNSKSAPFATVQAALACAGDGDVVSLAPSGNKPYPGVGTIGHSVTIKAGSGDARSVRIDLSQPQDSAGYTAGLVAVPATVSVKLQGVTLACSSTSFAGCLSQTCETTPAWGRWSPTTAPCR